MKDLITAVASILLLMIFVLQFAGNQVTHLRVFQSGLAVESFRDMLKAEGTASAVNKEHLQQELADICGCSPENISVMTREDGEGISYEISFPLQNLIVMGPVLGISSEENQVEIKEKGWVSSSYEEPDYNNGTDSSDDDGDCP